MKEKEDLISDLFKTPALLKGVLNGGPGPELLPALPRDGAPTKWMVLPEELDGDCLGTVINAPRALHCSHLQ